jgi:uncharacterized membrane protein YoaK (UPF0700 family)
VNFDRILVISSLSFVAGFVDTASFIALFGLFTAYVTGNLAVLAAEIVRESEKVATRVLIIPVFILTIVGTTLYVRQRASGAGNVLRHTLALQAILLLIALAIAVHLGPPQHPNGLTMLIIGPLIVAAMAVQNAATRLVLRTVPTTLMTLNITQLTIDIVDLWRGRVSGDDRVQLRHRAVVLASAIASFLIGAAGGAFGFHVTSFWCLVVPLLVLVALAASEATLTVAVEQTSAPQ